MSREPVVSDARENLNFGRRESLLEAKNADAILRAFLSLPETHSRDDAEEGDRSLVLKTIVAASDIPVHHRSCLVRSVRRLEAA